MKTEIKTEPKITIELSMFEASWLQAAVQNPPFPPDEIEQNVDTFFESLFNALRSFTEAHAPLP